MKKFFIIFIFVLLLPIVYAKEDCSLKNIGSCLGETLYDFVLDVINAPVQPLITSFETLLSSSLPLAPFASFWSIIVYVLSFFYIFLFLYAGVQFMVSGYDAQKRAHAKESLKNALFLLILVQSSFYIYSLLVDINAYLTQGMLQLLSDRFFLVADLGWDAGFEVIFVLLYMVQLLLGVLLLLLRFFLVTLGVVWFPIGIFLYFVPPLREYGKAIIHFFLGIIFVPFILTFIFIIGDKLLHIDIFSGMKSFVLITSLMIVNLTLLYITILTLLKAFVSKSGEFVQKAAGTARAVAYFL